MSKVHLQNDEYMKMFSNLLSLFKTEIHPLASKTHQPDPEVRLVCQEQEVRCSKLLLAMAWSDLHQLLSRRQEQEVVLLLPEYRGQEVQSRLEDFLMNWLQGRENITFVETGRDTGNEHIDVEPFLEKVIKQTQTNSVPEEQILLPLTKLENEKQKQIIIETGKQTKEEYVPDVKMPEKTNEYNNEELKSEQSCFKNKTGQDLVKKVESMHALKYMSANQFKCDTCPDGSINE